MDGINGDGLADLIVGTSGHSSYGFYTGASFVVFGGQGTSTTIGTTGADVLCGGVGNDILAIGLIPVLGCMHSRQGKLGSSEQ